MKKCFLLMAGIILLVFAACQSDELANGGRNSEVAAISSEKKIRVSQSWAKVTPRALPA